MSATFEFVNSGTRFLWSPHGSFINVRPVEQKVSDPPTDMIPIPDWVVVARIDQRVFESLCILWLEGDPSVVQASTARVTPGD